MRCSSHHTLMKLIFLSVFLILITASTTLVQGTVSPLPDDGSNVSRAYSEFASTVWFYNVDRISGDDFGQSVAIDGNTAIIGEPGDYIDDYNFDTHSAGSVYVFVRNAAGQWEPQQTITPDIRKGRSNFGEELAIEGNTAVVAAPYEDIEFVDHTDTNVGAVYVFTRDASGKWSQQQRLEAFDRLEGDEFGSSVAISGNTIVVGAVGDDLETGSAYVFTLVNNSWQLQQKIGSADGGSASDYFGETVAIEGDTIAVAATSVGPNRVGRVFVYTRKNGVWTPQQSLEPTDTTNVDEFGSSLDIQGNTILIGADRSNNDIGAAYIFTRSGSTWSQKQMLVAQNGVPNDFFGQSVALDNGVALVSAFQAGDGFNGIVYAFVKSGTMWVEAQQLADSSSFGFGMSVALDNGTVIVGAPNTDSGLGAAYAFESGTYQAGNLIQNGGFEGTALAGKIPVEWQGKKTSIIGKDKQKCNKVDKTFSYSGDCAFMFKGNASGDLSKLSQNVNDLYLVTHGSTLNFSAYVNPKSANVGHPIAKMILKYSDGNKDKLSLRVPGGSDYTLVNDSVAISLSGRTITKLKVQLQYRLSSGKYLVDDASLTVVPALTTPESLLPLPDAQ